MIQIDRIRLQLPAGFEHRATLIARLVGDVLAKQHISQDVSLESISIIQQRLSLNMSDTEIAHSIVEKIISNNRGMK